MPRPVPLLLAAALTLPVGCDGQPVPPQPVDSDPTPSADPAAFEAIRNRAFQMHAAGVDLLATREALLEAHALDPAAFGVNRRLGLVLTDLGMHPDAVEHFALALESHPEDLPVRQHLVALLGQLDRHEEALTHLPPLKDDPEYAGEAIYLEANMLDMAGEREAALALVAPTDALDPAGAHRAQALHGRFLFQAGDLEGALQRFELSQRGRPDYKAALKGLADCHRRLGHDDQADHWARVLELVLSLTDDEFIKKRTGQRRTRLIEVLELLPEWTDGYRQLANLHRSEGDDAEACAVIERFIERFPELLDDEASAQLRARYCEEPS